MFTNNRNEVLDGVLNTKILGIQTMSCTSVPYLACLLVDHHDAQPLCAATPTALALPGLAASHQQLLLRLGFAPLGGLPAGSAAPAAALWQLCSAAVCSCAAQPADDWGLERASVEACCVVLSERAVGPAGRRGC